LKEAVFPFTMFPEVDPVLGPEMRSTGEVMGIADSFGMAYFKAEEGAKPALPVKGTVLISIADKNEPAVADMAKRFQALGFIIKATEGTKKMLDSFGIKSEHILKIYEGRPNIVDGIKNREIDLIINTPAGKRSLYDDSYIRKEAIKYNIPYITTTAAAAAAARGIEAFRTKQAGVRSLQSYHSDIK
jgi:carbamoyl-phosphate synthase large subunit